MKVYGSAQEKILPVMAKGDAINIKDINGLQHFTEPPARYSDATLVKALEEHGIGRPSTYAPTISTVIDRGYAVDRDDNKKLFPTETAMIVTDMLVKHFSDVVDFLLRPSWKTRSMKWRKASGMGAHAAYSP